MTTFSVLDVGHFLILTKNWNVSFSFWGITNFLVPFKCLYSLWKGVIREHKKYCNYFHFENYYQVQLKKNSAKQTLANWKAIPKRRLSIQKRPLTSPTADVSHVRVWMTEPVDRLQMFNKTGKKWQSTTTNFNDVTTILGKLW